MRAMNILTGLLLSLLLAATAQASEACPQQSLFYGRCDLWWKCCL